MPHISCTAKNNHTFPDWLKISRAEHTPGAIEALLRERQLATVCESANCPNRGECFSQNKATVLILGSVCTRSCRFCSVAQGTPELLDPREPQHVAELAQQAGLRHIVITSVTRDDLPDGGAAHFAETVTAVRALNPGIRVEVLTPDFQGDHEAAARVAESGITIFNHNIETVPRLYAQVRPEADYARSLALLDFVHTQYPELLVKSGLMAGLGESDAEIYGVLRDLRAHGCDIVTIGQYLQPAAGNLPVGRFVPPELFEEYARRGRLLGFLSVSAGPFVRSSYNAEELYRALAHAEA